MDSEHIEHNGKVLTVYITQEKIKERIADLARQISLDYTDKNPMIIGILNGVFMFLSDLVREFTFHDFDIDFIKLASYQGTQSTGVVQELIGLKSQLKGRHVLLVDDILESGQTLNKLLTTVRGLEVASVKSCVFVNKPGKLKLDIKADYVGVDIDDVFIIGYGMDWDERFRGLRQLYIAKDKE